MKALKLKDTKKQDIKQQKKISNKPAVQRKKIMQKQTKLDSSESVQQSSSQLENYKAFFQYLLSNDDNKLADES
ncbi:hypothetical protein GAMM_60168 [Gammaproteobacteria bacterium]